MPRSWHSSTSYFSFSPTVLPQTSQMSPRASLGLPQRGHSTSCSPYGSAISVWPQPVQLQKALVGLLLDFDQVRDRNRRLDFREVDALAVDVLGKAVHADEDLR